MNPAYGYNPDDDPDALKKPDFDQDYGGGGGDLARPQFENPALALSQKPQALPDERPALALAPDERGGGSPTNALALQQPDETIETPWGTTVLPPGYSPDAETRDHIARNGFAPLASGGTHIDPYELANDPKWRGTPQYRALMERKTMDEIRRGDRGENAVDAVSGPPGGGPPASRPNIPGGALTPEQEALAAITPEPGADAVDQELARAGQQPAKPLTIQEQEQQTMGEQDKLLEQQIDAKKRADAAQAKINEEAAKQADQQARIEQAHAAEQQQIVAQANARTQQWMDRQQAEMDKFQNMGLHDYVQDMPLFNKILAGLSMLTGAAGGTPPDRNPGVIAIRDATERNFRLQQQAILKQKEIVGMAKEGVETSLSSKQQQLADSNLKKAAAYDAIAAQGVAMKLRQGVPLAEANNDSAILALRQTANQTRMETLKAVHTQNVQDVQMQYQGELAKSLEAHRLAQEAAEKERADAAMLSAQARAHKGHGGGGGGGGHGVDTAVVTLRKEMQDAVNAGKPMSGDQVTARAVQLGIPLKAKAGRVSLDTVQAQIAREGGIHAREARQESKDVTDWARANQIPALIKKQDELQAVVDEIDAAPHNPLQQALAVEKAVSSARGGAASKQALALALEHLGRKYTSLEDVKRAVISKELGEKQMDNFVAFMRNQLGEAQREGLGKYQEFNNYIASQPAERRGQLEAQRGRVFSGVSGFGGKSKANVAEAPDVSEATPPSNGNALPGGNKIVKVRDKATGKIIEAVKTADGTLIDKATGQPLK